MKANLKMNRRLVLSAAALAPVAALPALAGPESDIQILFRRWKTLTAEYLTLHRMNEAGELTGDELEEKICPLFFRRYELEEEIMAMDCVVLGDLLAKIEISDHHDWNLEDYNDAIGRSAKAMVA